MRTLKKTLCLVLALVMMLGLCAVSASATDFTDDAKIGDNYREALEIISALGIINGKDDGSYYDPQGTLTRVEGCYIISRLVKGETGSKATSHFKDVPAGSEAAVVDFMWSSGYADGYDDVSFGPNDTMLGSHFAKWLLTVLGYNAEAEGLTGNTFDGAVRLLTARNGLARGIEGYDQDAEITREQAALMALNALQGTMMEYLNKTTVNTGDLSVIVYGNASRVPNTKTDYNVGGPNTDSFMQLCENYWPELTLESTDNDPDLSQLNTPVDRVWVYGSEPLYKTMQTPVMTYTGKANATTVSGDLSGYYMVRNGTSGDTQLKDTSRRLYVNNATKYYTGSTNTNTTAVLTVNGASLSDLTTAADVDFTITGRTFNFTSIADEDDAVTLANAIASLTANGRAVEIYAGNPDYPKMITEIIITCYTVAKVDSITTSGTKTTYTFVGTETKGDVDLTAETYSDAVRDNTLFADDALAKGDIVTITSADDNKALNTAATLCVYKAEKHTGVQGDHDNKGNVTIDGTAYKVAEGVIKSSTDGTSLLTSSSDFDKNAKEEADYYLDNFGYVVYNAGVKTATNYAFIVSATGEAKVGLDDNKPVITVRAVLVEDSKADVGVYTVAVEKKSADDLEDDHDYLYYPDETAGTYTKADATDSTPNGVNSADNLWVIKNTSIVVGKTVDTSFTAWKDEAHAAQLLMSDIYGYVYKYTLKDGELTLTPLENGYGSISPETDTTFAGQTTEKIVSGKNNYGNASTANGANTYVKPGTGSTSGDDVDVVINAGTPVVVFNAKNNTARIQTGLAGLTEAKSGYGYFAAGGTGSRMNAKIVFISTENGISATTSDRTIVYVDTGTIKTVGTGNDAYHTYTARDENGGTRTVRDGGEDPVKDISGGANKGLYKVDADGLIVEKLLIAGDVSGMEDGDIDGNAPYWYVAAAAADASDNVDGDDMLKSDIEADTGNNQWSFANANKIVVKSGGNYKRDALFIIFEVNSSGDLTGFVKTAFVV